MVIENLTSKMEDAGKALIETLDRANLDISAALWFYYPEQNLWRLLIASPEVRTHGPKQVYQKVQAAIAHNPEQLDGIDLGNVSVITPDHSLITLLSHAVRTGHGISGIRFSRNTINGQFIEDAYIYRM